MMTGAGFRETLAAARAGDEHAFRELWRRLHPPLLRYLKVGAGDAADDLASETWLDVVRGLQRFQGDEPDFRAWVFTIARHRLMDWRRARARRPADPAPVELFTDRHATDDPAAAALETLSVEAALALIAQLPADQAEVVTLRAVAGLDVARVARILGKRPGTVRVLAHRGLRTLARRLAAGHPILTGD